MPELCVLVLLAMRSGVLEVSELEEPLTDKRKFSSMQTIEITYCTQCCFLIH